MQMLVLAAFVLSLVLTTPQTLRDLVPADWPAAVGVGVALMLADDGKVCEAAAIALGAVASTPMRARAAEGMVRGQVLTPQLIAAVAEKAADEAKPISDVRASAGFRRELVRVLTGRMIETALENARQRAAAQRRVA